MLKQTAQIGIHLGATSLLAVRRCQSKIVGQWEVPCEPDLSASLCVLKKIIDYRQEPVISHVRYSQTLNKVVEMEASLSESEIDHFIADQAPIWFSQDSIPLALDFYHLPSQYHKKSIRVVACEQKLIRELSQQFKLAGLRLTCVSVDAFAITEFPDFFVPKVIAYFDFITNPFTFVVIQNHDFLYAKQFELKEISIHALQSIFHRALNFFNCYYPDVVIDEVIINIDNAPIEFEKSIKKEWKKARFIKNPYVVSVGLAATRERH